MDEHSIPGMDRVDKLAVYLVELRSEAGLSLSNQQASTIVDLWQNLEQHDKERIVYAARHQERLRWKALKGVFLVPRALQPSGQTAVAWLKPYSPDYATFITAPKKLDDKHFQDGH